LLYPPGPVCWNVSRISFAAAKARLKKPNLRTILLALLVAAVLSWLMAALMLVAAKWIDPPTTAVQTERRVQSWFSDKPYQKRYEFVPLNQISPSFQHAVVSAEDARFYLHHGFDWNQVQIAAHEDMEGERTRGASTLTQQLVKNLLFGTSRSVLRKGLETTLVPVAELVLGKRRILELYLNVVEWGPGVYGAEAASRYWFKTSARTMGREQSAQLAAILPAPLKRKPERMHRYPEIILKRMSQVGW
jgi:monofunctional glycosyltransferase